MSETTRRTLQVAVLANRKGSIDAGPDSPADVLAEYDAEETVESIIEVLTEAGHTAFFLEADGSLLDTIRASRPDMVFNIAEGLRGAAREAQVPALLEMLGIPYTGSNVLTHAVSLDKVVTKRLWHERGLPTAPFQLMRHAEAVLVDGLAFPLFVKPMREGSGMGINADSIVEDERSLRTQVRWVIETYRQPALVETYLPGREFTVGFVGNRTAAGARCQRSFYMEGFHVFPVLEIDTQKGEVKGIYNAQAKGYAIASDTAPGYLCPADIPPELALTLKDLALTAFEAVGGFDVARVDFRMDAASQPYLMEINTLPGLNPQASDIVIAARAEGVAYPVLIREILDLARERYGLL